MKSRLLVLLLAVSTNSFSQTTAIPDPNFEQALINLGHDITLDGSVLTANISSVTTLNVSGNSITDMTGIEDFTSLTHLDCWSNLLTSLDISQITNLVSLDCGANLLTSLDASQNIALTDLIINFNQLTSIDISQNINLSGFHIHGNQLTTLDVSNNTALTFLGCGLNSLTSLDVSQNTALVTLGCINNQLIELDVSQHNVLSTLYCGGNNLNCLNFKNGNYLNVIDFWAQDNPNLTCIEVDDVTYSTTNWTIIPPTASFSTDCNNDCSVGIKEITNYGAKELTKIVDLMGRETEFKTNTPLIYIYSDGTTERVYEIDL